MSLDIYVLFMENLPTIRKLQQHLDLIGLPLAIDPGGNVELSQGYVPARWENREAGFECSFENVDEFVETYSDVDFEGSWQHVTAFHYSSFPGGVGAIMAAAGLAHATGGIVYDPQEEAVFDVAAAADHARAVAISIPDIEARYDRGEFRTR